MATMADSPATVLLPARRFAEARAKLANSRLTLCATEDGWSLLDPRGEVAFRALGVRSRRECLAFARSRGVCVVLS
jgi:hypothetical protein